MKKYKINISEERHSSDLESLGSIFMPIIKNSLSAEDLIGTDIILNWRNIIGNEMATFCQPLNTKYNPHTNCRTLYIETPVGGFALEIQHRENYILEKINAYFGYQAIHKLNISQNANIRPMFTGKKAENTQELEVSEEDKKYLMQLTEEIKDEKLRENLIKIGKKILLANKE